VWAGHPDVQRWKYMSPSASQLHNVCETIQQHKNINVALWSERTPPDPNNSTYTYTKNNVCSAVLVVMVVLIVVIVVMGGRLSRRRVGGIDVGGSVSV